MNTNEVRKKFIDFYTERGHTAIPSASLVPENDPTTLFTGSGMQPLVPYLLGEKHPEGTRLVNSQKAFRADDIDEVGDNRHTTFFEMLGNWSLGDYFKGEQLPWVYEFLTDVIGLRPENIYVTVFEGDTELKIPRDEESIILWKQLFEEKDISHAVGSMGSEVGGSRRGMQQDERIFTYDATKNWWSRSGTPEHMPEGEIGGPDSEIFYDFGTPHDTAFGEHCHPNCDCGRFIEIGNSVFMEYIKKDGAFELLPQKNVDFGGGLERITAVSQNEPDIFLANESLAHTITHLETASGKHYHEHIQAFRIIADHLRGVVFMLSDGIVPSNTEQGYFARRLIRRSVQHADAIGIIEGQLTDALAGIIHAYTSHYPELAAHQQTITAIFADEEAKFRVTLAKGMKEFQKIAHTGAVTGADAFLLFTSYGFPFELTQELADTQGILVDQNDFQTHMQAHQAQSRAGAEHKFKGGLADHSEKTTHYHTTHHLLLKALQTVLGDHIKQRGSNITSERLRIDFSHDAKLTDEEKTKVEQLVNDMIQADLPVIKTILPKAEAEQLGAEQEFGQKYPDMVNVYSIGPHEAAEGDPHFAEASSIEFCGGPHVSHTGAIKGTFRIAKEKASSAGVRRIRGVLE